MFYLGDKKIERRDNGSVNIQNQAPCGCEQSMIFTADEWVSAVTSVAKDADTAETHEAVKKIHGVE